MDETIIWIAQIVDLQKTFKMVQNQNEFRKNYDNQLFKFCIGVSTVYAVSLYSTYTDVPWGLNCMDHAVWYIVKYP